MDAKSDVAPAHESRVGHLVKALVTILEHHDVPGVYGADGAIESVLHAVERRVVGRAHRLVE